MNKIDQNGLNVIPYAAQSFYGKGLAFFLAQGVPVQDVPELQELFHSEDAFDRLVLVLTYADRPKALLERAQKEQRFMQRFLALYVGSGLPYPEAACEGYVTVKEPEWEKDMQEVAGEIGAVRASFEKLMAIDLEKFDSVLETTKELVSAMAEFVSGYKKCRYAMNELQGVFADFEPFISECIGQMERSLKYVKEGDSEFLESIWKANCKSPLLHCAVAERLGGHDDRFVSFGEALVEKMKAKKANIPDFDTFFDGKRQELKSIGLGLADKFFDKLNTFYYRMHAQTSTDFVKSELSAFVASMLGSEQKEPSKSQDIQAVEVELDQSINSLRLFCASMGLPLPKLSEEKSSYQMTEEQKSMALVRTQLKETQEMEQKISELNEAMEELRKYSSICTKCRKYCASYICPHCHVFLYCVLCKETDQQCPVCFKDFSEPLLIKKTCYFGDEFEIKLRQEQQQQRELESQQAPQ